MPEQGPSRRPDELTTDTVASFMFDAEGMRADYTWQQLESLARRAQEAARDKRAEADELLLQARALQMDAEILDTRAESLHDASQKTLDEGTTPRHLS